MSVCDDLIYGLPHGEVGWESPQHASCSVWLESRPVSGSAALWSNLRIRFSRVDRREKTN